MGRQRPEKAWGSLSNVIHSTLQKHGRRGHNKKQHWKWLLSLYNAHLAKQKPFSLLYEALWGSNRLCLNCSSKEDLIISCKTEEGSRKCSQEEAAWELIVDLLIFWVNEDRFQSRTTTKVVPLKRSSLFSVFGKQEKLRKMESVTTNTLSVESLCRWTAAGSGSRCAPAWVPEPSNLRSGP